MSKLNIKLSYKNACILKHALRDKIYEKEYLINEVYPGKLSNNTEGYSEEELKKCNKELDEEKRAFIVITEQIEKAMYAHGRSYINRTKGDVR